MRRAILFIIGAIFISSLSFAQNSNDNSSAASINFEEKVHDFGTIEENSDGTCTFSFKNSGNEPLVITEVITSCGCTDPDYPDRPIMPGEKNQIEIAYDTSKLGNINEQIIVRSNCGRRDDDSED